MLYSHLSKSAKWTLALFFSLALSQPGHSGPPALGPETYQEIRDLSLDILKRYEPSEYYYVGVGRAPFPLIDTIEHLHPRSTAHLPLSNLRFRAGIVSFESKANPTRVLWKPYKTRIWKSFAKQLPDAKALRGRKLLLIDLAVRGNGIQGATHLVREFLKDGHCPDCETRSLGLLYHQPRDTTEFVLREAGIDVIVLNQKYPRLTEDLTQELLKPYAPYSSFDPRIHLRPEANPLHAEFLASLKARLTGDTAECLKTYLRSPGGALARP